MFCVSGTGILSVKDLVALVLADIMSLFAFKCT